MASTVEARLLAACKTGALVRHKVELEQGQLDNRRLWLRPEIAALPRKLDQHQAQVVAAALKRFVLGGEFTVVTAESEYHQAVRNIGDIRELKGPPPPFVELRFKPPKHELRLFGRFVGRNDLVLTTYGMKSSNEKTRQGWPDPRVILMGIKIENVIRQFAKAFRKKFVADHPGLKISMTTSRWRSNLSCCRAMKCLQSSPSRQTVSAEQLSERI
jgi:hypothetical protein